MYSQSENPYAAPSVPSVEKPLYLKGRTLGDAVQLIRVAMKRHNSFKCNGSGMDGKRLMLHSYGENPEIKEFLNRCKSRHLGSFFSEGFFDLTAVDLKDPFIRPEKMTEQEQAALGSLLIKLQNSLDNVKSESHKIDYGYVDYHLHILKDRLELVLQDLDITSLLEEKKASVFRDIDYHGSETVNYLRNHLHRGKSKNSDGLMQAGEEFGKVLDEAKPLLMKLRHNLEYDMAHTIAEKAAKQTIGHKLKTALGAVCPIKHFSNLQPERASHERH